jgi:hypothetical protein
MMVYMNWTPRVTIVPLTVQMRKLQCLTGLFWEMEMKTTQSLHRHRLRWSQS